MVNTYQNRRNFHHKTVFFLQNTNQIAVLLDLNYPLGKHNNQMKSNYFQFHDLLLMISSVHFLQAF
jgi:hypothetical protein